MKKIFREGIIASVIMVFIISFINLLVMKTENYTFDWHSNIFKIDLILVCIVPFIYYYLIRRDKSESIALFLTSFILWLTGLTDLLYFWFQGKALPYTLPWLNDQFIISKISNIIGLSTVTSTSLIVSVMVGCAIVIMLDIALEKIN